MPIRTCFRYFTNLLTFIINIYSIAFESTSVPFPDAMPYTMASKIYPFKTTRSSVDLLPSKMAWVNRKAFCHLMKPLFWCMKIVGLLHGVPLRAKDTEENVSSSVKSCERIYKIYAIIVILILWFNFALALSSFGNVTKFDGIVCNQIITTMWFFQIAYCSVCNFVVCKHLKEFCEMFDKVIEYINFDNFSYIRKCAVVATVLYVLWLMIAFTFTGLGSYFLNGNVAGPFGQVSPVVDIVMRIVFLITYFYFTSTWYLIMAPFLVISMVLLKAFKHFNKSFKQCFDNGKFKADIETTRMQHEQLTRVLAQADKVYSMYIMSSIGTVIPLIIFTLYFVLFESIDTFSYIATWWSACLSITQMLVIFLGGGLVNHEVRHFNLKQGFLVHDLIPL